MGIKKRREHCSKIELVLTQKEEGEKKEGDLLKSAEEDDDEVTKMINDIV